MGRIISDANAVKLYYHRRSNRLNYGTATVPTIPPTEGNDRLFGGPLPVATYLVDVMRNNTNMDPPIEWCNLHAPLEDGSGYYGYADNWESKLIRDRRDAFGIHPGQRSLGCVAIKAAEWPSVREFIRSGALIYEGNNGKQQRFCGYLTVTDD